jgi:hypothetical protein
LNDCESPQTFVEMPFVAALGLTPAQLVGISLTELQRPLPHRQPVAEP